MTQQEIEQQAVAETILRRRIEAEIVEFIRRQARECDYETREVVDEIAKEIERGEYR